MIRHIRELWGRAWFVPAIPLFYAAAIWLLGQFRPEHVLVGLLACAVGYATQKTKEFYLEVLPFVAVGIGYDLVRYARAALVTPERVVGCELRSLELALFSVAPGVTPQDWFIRHNHPALDLFLAVPYTIFVYLAFAYAAYLYFVDRPRMRHYLWSFAIANYISFLFWLALPAAPPWYLRAHSCAIDVAVAPSPAGLLRVDHALGTTYFQAFYSRAASVFGALPSMHCAYPMLGLLTARHVATARTWPLHIGYVLAMFAASVYFDHHWIVDALLGWGVAVVAVALAKALLARNPGHLAAPELGMEPQWSEARGPAPPKVL